MDATPRQVCIIVYKYVGRKCDYGNVILRTNVLTRTLCDSTLCIVYYTLGNSGMVD